MGGGLLRQQCKNSAWTSMPNRICRGLVSRGMLRCLCVSIWNPCVVCDVVGPIACSGLQGVRHR